MVSSDVYLVVEDSPVFAALEAQTVREYAGSGATVVLCRNYDEAQVHIAEGGVKLIICGYGIGDGKTAHDLRLITDAPMVIMTGRPSGVDAPSGAKVILKSAGPERLKQTITELAG